MLMSVYPSFDACGDLTPNSDPEKAAAELERRGISAGAVPERIWTNVYIRRLDAEKVAREAEPCYASTRAAAGPRKRR